jgi:hypothetical protein
MDKSTVGYWLLFIFICVILLAGARGQALMIGQGDDVYLGECGLDISLAISWPDYTIAWCKSAYPGCLPPDQIITIESYQRNYCINSSLYHPGWYYRWDGHWNNGENQDAFRVRVGTRPVDNATANITPEPTPTPLPGIDMKGNGPFEWIIARGDSPDITFRYATTDPGVCGTGAGNDLAHLWLFGSTEMLMDIPLETMKDNNYQLGLSADDTAALGTGKYTGYIQFPGLNGRQDVFYEPIAKCLDTPYDDAYVPDQVINIRNPDGTKGLFENMVKNLKYSDDLLIPITLQMKDPEISITDITQGQDKMWITGITTWSEGTEITFRLDDDNYALASDKRKHTWTTTVNGSLVNWRKFDQVVPIEMKDMYIGMHELKMTVDKNGYVVNTFHNFRITGTYVMPTPTPEFVKYITDVNGTRVLPVVNITEAPTPVVTQVQAVSAPVYTETPITVKPTPLPTTVKPTAIPTTESLVIPVNPILGFLAIGIAWVIVWRK